MTESADRRTDRADRPALSDEIDHELLGRDPEELAKDASNRSDKANVHLNTSPAPLADGEEEGPAGSSGRF